MRFRSDGGRLRCVRCVLQNVSLYTPAPHSRITSFGHVCTPCAFRMRRAGVGMTTLYSIVYNGQLLLCDTGCWCEVAVAHDCYGTRARAIFVVWAQTRDNMERKRLRARKTRTYAVAMMPVCMLDCERERERDQFAISTTRAVSLVRLSSQMPKGSRTAFHKIRVDIRFPQRNHNI